MALDTWDWICCGCGKSGLTEVGSGLRGSIALMRSIALEKIAARHKLLSPYCHKETISLIGSDGVQRRFEDGEEVLMEG